jgi:DedD protein
VDSQVKERVVGATVLVALGVLIIPWVLNGPDTPLAEDAAESGIRLPAPGEAAPIRTEVVELAPDRAPGPDSAAAAFEAQSNGRQGTETAQLAEPTPPAQRGARAAAREEEPGSGRSSGADEPPSAPASGTVAPSAAAPSEPLSASAQAAAAQSGAWLVQLGAFSEAVNARQLASRVDGFGYDAEVSDTRSGNKVLHRVRVGGFETREQAEAAKSSLSAHGFVAQVLPAE